MSTCVAVPAYGVTINTKKALKEALAAKPGMDFRCVCYGTPHRYISVREAQQHKITIEVRNNGYEQKLLGVIYPDTNGKVA